MRMEETCRVFLQAMMAEKVLKKSDAELLCKKVQQISETDQEYSLLDVVSNINKSLESMGMKINYGRLEVDGTEWYGIVNTVRDAAAKKACAHLNQVQFEFLKKTLQLMVSDDQEVSSDTLLRAVDSLQRKMTKRAAQDLLDDLVRDKWLYKAERRGCYVYTIGPRCVLELLPFLTEITGQTVDECKLCSVNVVLGQRCTNCDTKLHLYCIAKLARSRQVNCPQCRERWAHEVPRLKIT